MYGLAQACIEYYTNPVLTTLSLKSPSSIEFPEVYICPSNSYNLSSLHAVEAYLKLSYYLPKRISLSHLQRGNFLKSVMTSFKEVVMDSRWRVSLNFAGLNATELEQVILELTMSTTGFVRECQFGPSILPCESVVQKIVDKEYGVCFLVNVRQRQHMAGAGLRLLLDFSPHLYPRHETATLPFAGAQISIHKQFDPFSVTGHYVSPGKLTSIGIRKNEIHLINVAYDDD